MAIAFLQQQLMCSLSEGQQNKLFLSIVILPEKVIVMLDLDKNCCLWAMGRVVNPEKEERPPLEAVARRLVKTEQTE
jgi:hypothetical protein